MDAVSETAPIPHPADAGPDPHAGMHKVGNGWVTEARWQEILEIRRQNALRTNEKAKTGEAAPKPDEEAKSASYRDTLAWVLEHIWEASCPKGATPLARSLWEAAKDRKAEFVSENMPLLVRGEKVQEQEEDEGGEVNRKLVEDLIAEFRGVCPKCGRGPDDVVSEGREQERSVSE